MAQRTNKTKQDKDIAEYEMIAKRYNALLMKGKLSKSATARDAIYARLMPLQKKLNDKVEYMKSTYPQLLK